MGERGPISRWKPSAGLVPVDRLAHPVDPPSAPGDLRAAGLACWTSVWNTAPQLVRSDALVVAQLARMMDEASDLRAVVQEDGGPILSRPIVTPRGEVVGDERVAHPGMRELRRIDAAVLALAQQLGISPMARGRLGLTVMELELQADAVDELRKERARRRGEPDPGIDGPREW
jgi:hypothetical protein